MELIDLHKHFLEVNQNFTTDTRNIENGAIFFALKGDNFNGNKFAEQAIASGASLVVLDEAAYAVKGKTYLTNDVLQTLQELATYHRNYLGIPILSLTGSNGKTTTKELIREVLKQKFRVSATLGNLNNHIGVPMTLLSMTKETEFGIVEMGANHLKEIELLSNISQPNYGYITNFGKAHLEGFGSEEGIVKGKSELYDFLAKNRGKAFVNNQDKRQMEKAFSCEIIEVKPEQYPLQGLTPYVRVQTNEGPIQTNLIGKYNYTNILAAITIGQYFDIPLTAIKKGIEEYVPTNNRSQIIEKNGVQIILDAYNANPTSMKAALDNLDSLNVPKKAIVIGDMFELGTTSEVEHQHITELAEKYRFDKIYLIGNHFYQTKTATTIGVNQFESFDAFKKGFKDDFTGCTLLIKGSRGMALERVLELI